MATTATATATATAKYGSPAVDAQVLAQLRTMFPQLDDETLAVVLVAHMGHTGMAINALLDVASSSSSSSSSNNPATKRRGGGVTETLTHSASPSFYAGLPPRSNSKERQQQQQQHANNADSASNASPNRMPSRPDQQQQHHRQQSPPPIPKPYSSSPGSLSKSTSKSSLSATSDINEDAYLESALAPDILGQASPSLSLRSQAVSKRLQPYTLDVAANTPVVRKGSVSSQGSAMAKPASPLAGTPPMTVDSHIRFEDDDLTTWSDVIWGAYDFTSDDDGDVDDEDDDDDDDGDDEDQGPYVATTRHIRTTMSSSPSSTFAATQRKDSNGYDSSGSGPPTPTSRDKDSMDEANPNFVKTRAKGALRFLKGMSAGGDAQFTSDISSSQVRKLEAGKGTFSSAKSFLSTKMEAAKKAATTAAAAISDAINDRTDDEADTQFISTNSTSLAPKKTRKLKINAVFQAAVSKDRTRFVNEDFDLDLTYITPRIIAMSFPAEGLETAYRNSLEEVARLLRKEHAEGYMVYNLSERSYDVSKLNNQVFDFGWPDHQAPPLKLLFTICTSIDAWLKSDPSHVVSIHCKGGKGRTGTVICSYMIYCGLCKNEYEAMDRFGTKRMAGDKMGVTQPSQQRYIKYFKSIIYRELKLHTQSLLLYRVNLSVAPRVDRAGECSPFLRVYQGAELVYATATKTSKDAIKSYTRDDGPIAFPMEVVLREDVMIQCFEYSQYSSVSKIFRCQFFIGCIDKLIVRFTKDELDDACLDKKIPNDFYMDLLFRIVDGRKETHPLERYAPDNMEKLEGDICYFGDQERNSRYMASGSSPATAMHISAPLPSGATNTPLAP